MEKPFISICIPAYKNEKFLSRLLDSIRIQEFTDFEVVISDDSPDFRLKELIETYKKDFKIVYIKNESPLGSPANWNNAIAKATGKWIKLMHDDDWFVDRSSLDRFAYYAKRLNTSFIFSGFYNVTDSTSSKHVVGFINQTLLRKNPVYLLRKNFVGHPSTTLVRNDNINWYDVRYKWVVDIEFYIRRFSTDKNYFIIREPLVNLGIGDQQITSTVFRKPEVEIPENISFLKDITPRSLRNIFAYDYFWRFIRNLSVRNAGVVHKYSNNTDIPVILTFMIKQQAMFPLWIIRIGIFSKFVMFFSYLWNRINRRIK